MLLSNRTRAPVPHREKRAILADVDVGHWIAPAPGMGRTDGVGVQSSCSEVHFQKETGFRRAKVCSANK
jgi:hypothetical protein